MILTERLALATARGTKTTHRLPVGTPTTWQRHRVINGEKRYYGPIETREPWKPEVTDHPLHVACREQDEEGQPRVSAYVKVLDYEETTLKVLTRAEATREGYVGPLDFRRDWIQRYDKAWARKQDELTDEMVTARFNDRHVGTDIYVVHWQVCAAPALCLADPRRGAGDYTHSPSLAIDPLAEVLEVDALRLKKAQLEGEKQRASFRRDLEAERAVRKAQRRPWVQAA